MPPLLIDIPQMIDLALGTPEIGVVNFTVLHSLLHAMTEIFNLDKYRVEFRGNQGMKIEKLIHHIPLQPIVTVQEFEVDETADTNQKISKRTLIQKEKTGNFNKILVIRKTEEIEDGVQGRRSVQQPIQVMSQDDFRKLEPGSNDSIHDTVGRHLPSNQEYFDSARGESEEGRNPYGDMWHILNITKRVDATEVAIEKVMSMLRDMSEEYKRIKNAVDRISAMSDVSDIMDKIDFLEKMCHDYFNKQPADTLGGRKPISKPDIRPTPALVAVTGERAPPKQLVTVTSSPGRIAGGTASALKKQPTSQEQGATFQNFYIEHDLHAPQGAQDDILVQIDILKSEIEKIKAILDQDHFLSKSFTDATSPIATENGSAGSNSPLPSPTAKGNTKDIHRRMKLLESKFNAMEHQIFDLEKELAELVDRSEDDRPNTRIKTDIAGIADVYAKVTTIKADLDTTIERCNFLIIERDQIVESIERIMKKLGDLKHIKVDKDEIDELLAEKADYSMLQRKVSVDQFDATKRHLTTGLVEALDKLNEQSKIWEKAVYEIRSIVEGKVGKEELSPLKEYVDSKITAIQERLKALVALRRDPEAAGTKSKYLRQVNCISCDQDVIMRVDEPSAIPRRPPVPAASNLKPFLVYELDSIRKQMKDPNTRNLHHFETMSKDKPQVMVEGRLRQPANRYCGGSHTILTPQDRAQRCKFNRKHVPAECFFKGDEGYYYRTMKKTCICPDQKVESAKIEEEKQEEQTEEDREHVTSRSELKVVSSIHRKVSRSEMPVTPSPPSSPIIKVNVIKQISSIISSKSELHKQSDAGGETGSKVVLNGGTASTKKISLVAGTLLERYAEEKEISSVKFETDKVKTEDQDGTGEVSSNIELVEETEPNMDELKPKAEDELEEISSTVKERSQTKLKVDEIKGDETINVSIYEPANAELEVIAVELADVVIQEVTNEVPEKDSSEERAKNAE